MMERRKNEEQILECISELAPAWPQLQLTASSCGAADSERHPMLICSGEGSEKDLSLSYLYLYQLHSS